MTSLHRRYLTESQRADSAATVANMPWGGDRRSAPDQTANLPFERPPLAPPLIFIADAARILNVSERSVASARKVRGAGAPELVAALDGGDMAAALASPRIAAVGVVTSPPPTAHPPTPGGYRLALPRCACPTPSQFLGGFLDSVGVNAPRHCKRSEGADATPDPLSAP